MPDQDDFRKRVQRIGTLVQEIENIADPALRASTKGLVQLIMEFHGTGLERALEILADAGDLGLALIDKLGRDPIVSSLLVLYGLHPETLDERVSKAVEGLKAKLQRDGAQVQLLGVEDGAVRLRVTLGEHACGSTTKALKAEVENAIYDAAPDVASLSVEGLEGKPADGFVSLNDLMADRVNADTAVPAASPTAANYGD